MKKRLLKGVVSASVSLLAFNAAALNVRDHMDLVPYIGADIQSRHMEFKKGYGDNITKKNYPQGNIYLGLKLNEYVGLEAGYERTKNVKTSKILLGSDMFLSTILQPGDPTFATRINTRTKMSAFHASVVGFLPISEEYRLQLIGALGIARMNLNMAMEIPIADLRRVFSRKKWVPKVGVGLQHMLTCQVGVRAMASWEGTGRGSKSAQDIRPLNQSQSELVARVKNSLNLGLGIFYNFK